MSEKNTNNEPDFSDLAGKEYGNKLEEKRDHKGKKENKDIQKEDRKIYVINKYSQGILLAESILLNNIPKFIQIINGEIVISDKISLPDIDLVPPQRTEYLSKEYDFGSIDEIKYYIELAKKETLTSLHKKVKTIWKKYIDIDEDFINLCSADTIFSYFQDKMGMTHYLLITGDNNSGKSNILLLFSILGYRPLYDTSITPANIYNFCGSLEEGQGIIIEDEIDDIDNNEEKKRLYKIGYRSGSKVTRMYDNNSILIGNRRKSTRQQGFFTYCFKVFASEKIPDKIKSKGFIERLIILKTIPGDPKYDISEVINDAGDEKLKECYQELIQIRKLLLMFRLLHHTDSFPDIKLNIKNRYKQLTKPLLRLFQKTQVVNEIIESLSKYLVEKNEEKIDSFESMLLSVVIDLVAKFDLILYNDQIWDEIKNRYPKGEIQGKSHSWFIEGYGSISKTKITNICETKFGAKQHRDKENGRGLIFSQEKLNKLSVNYSAIEGIKILESHHGHEGDTYDGDDTYREDMEENNTNDFIDNDIEISKLDSNIQGNSIENNNIEQNTPICDNNNKNEDSV